MATPGPSPAGRIRFARDSRRVWSGAGRGRPELSPVTARRQPVRRPGRFDVPEAGGDTYTNFVVYWPAQVGTLPAGLLAVGGADDEVVVDLPALGGDPDGPTSDSTYIEITTQGTSLTTRHGPDLQTIVASGAGVDAAVVGALPGDAVLDGDVLARMLVDSPVTGSVYPDALSVAGIVGGGGDYPVTSGDQVYEFQVLDSVMDLGPGEEHDLSIGEKQGFKIRWVRIEAHYTGTLTV